jgi:MFS family permease
MSSLWRNGSFRSLWIGETVSQFGDRITELALPLMAVTMLGASAVQVGVLTAAVWLPNLLALVVGAWVDRRTRKRRLLVLADLARALTLLTIPVAYLLGALSLPQLYLVAILTGAGQVLFGTAYQSFFVALVPPESYVDAGSRLSLSRAASFVVGPALGGFLVQVFSAPFAILADALSFLGSALLIGRIPVPRTEAAPEGPSMASLIRDGLRLVFRHPVLRASLFCTTTINFFTLMANAIVILYASRSLGLSAATIGLTFGIGAMGAVAGASLAPRISRRVGVGRTATIGAVLFPAPLAVMALATGPHWAEAALLAAMELLSGIGVMLMDVNLNAVILQAAPGDALGRQAGAYSAVNYGVRPLGALAGGWLGTVLGLRPTLVIAGLGGALAVVFLVASPVPRISRLDVPEEAASATIGA